MCHTRDGDAARRGPRVHSNVARPARNVGAGPPRPPSSQQGRFCAVGSQGPNLIRLLPPRSFSFAGFERGLFRRLAAPRRPLVGRPDSNGLALPRFCRRIFGAREAGTVHAKECVFYE